MGNSVHQEHWYVVRSATSLEKRALASIENRHSVTEVRRGPEAYLPCRKNWARHNGRKTEVTRPLIPGYLFVRIEEDEFYQVAEADGVHAFLKNGRGEPAMVPATWVRLIQRAEAMSLFDHTVSKRWRKRTIGLGDQVRITGTAFMGRLAKVIELLTEVDRNGKDRVKKIRVDFGNGTGSLEPDHVELAA